MARSRRSARAAGSKFESDVAAYLADVLDDDRIERRVKNGAKDRGDVASVRFQGKRVVIEAKNVKVTALPQWVAEAEVERGNDEALIGVVVAKRHGNGRMADQWVHMTLADLAVLLTGTRDHIEREVVISSESS